MKTVCPRLGLLASLVLVSCEAPEKPVFVLQADRFAGAEWSEPVNLGPLINTSDLDANAALSPDGLTLYFVSTRQGGFGLQDVYSSQRRCVPCPWEAPVNLGASINSSTGDISPAVSENGHMLFVGSGRPGGFGGGDLYVSYRVSTGSDGEVWGPLVNLGPDVNTATAEQGAYYVHEVGEPNAFLYFNRTTPGGNADVYRVTVGHDGMPLGPAVLIPELSDPAGGDQKVTVRADGHELLLASIRAGGLGNFDIWSFTRQSAQDLWSNPGRLDAPVNSPDVDSQPSLSGDGGTLIFTSIRPGGYGMQDLWMSTRSPSGS